MNKILQIDFDTERKDVVRVMGEEHTTPDPWTDLAILIEACGCLASICKFDLQITEHNGKPVEQYLHEYFDKVFADYSVSYQTRNSGVKN